MLKLLFSLITSRILWGFLGLSALSAVVWIVGPLISVMDVRPLESSQNRFIAMAVLWLLWCSRLIIPRLYNAWLNRRLMDNLKSTAPTERQEGANPAGNDDPALTERFNEATQLLKKAHFSQAGGWKHRFSAQYLYQLPWYVIIGAPGSGKTTALANSGLQFPLAERFGKAALRGVGGTRNCDWWFTNEAVLLDTAGRYTTQESEQLQDAGEWLQFIRLLQKYRRRQPVNGIIITISISDLLTLPPQALEKQAISVRKRLVELHEQLGIRFPVYVLVTKADLLNGFRAWFSTTDKAQRDQIWGFTFDRERSQHADFNLIAEFQHAFSLLLQRLNAGLPDVLLQESSLSNRAECYLFPQEFAALRPQLTDYLNTIFSHSHFETAFTPRGIYFASGTQEGLPFDRVMGELNRALSLPDTRREGSRWDSISKEAPVPAGKGQSFFIKDLLQKVVFQESGIASLNRWWEIRSRAVAWLGYVLLALILLIAAALWFNSYKNNKHYLQEIDARLPAVEQTSLALRDNDRQDLFALLPLLNSLTHLPESDEFDVKSPPLSRRMGLYRGGDVIDASQALYRKALQQLLLPKVAARITYWLRTDNGHDAEYSYEALKAYKMLYNPAHYDGAFLYSWMVVNLERSLAQDITQTQLTQLKWHLSQLLETQIQTSPYAADDALMARETALINQNPLASRVYARLKRLLEHNENLKPVSVVSLGGQQSELVFSRKSGSSLNDGVPGLFTPQGYWNHFNGLTEQVVKSLREDDAWVLNTVLPEQQDTRQIDTAVRHLYAQDFIAHWDRFLGDIQLNSSSSLSQRINMTRLISASPSPLRNMVVNLAQNLMLTREGSGETSMMKARAEMNNATRTLEALFSNHDGAPTTGSATARTPEQLVVDHYAQIIALAQPLEKGGQAIVFDDILRQVDELYRYLTAVQSAANSGMPPPSDEVISRLQASAGRLPGGLQGMFTTMATGASSDARQRDMENVRKRVSVELGSFCRQAIAGRYPLVRNAATDVTPDDLARMFAPGTGMMDTFFRDNLATKVDTTRASWRFMPGVDGKTLPGSESMLRPFQQAQYIRDAFFATGSPLPSYRLTVRTVSMDNNILNLALDVDGQIMRYSHGPQAVQQFSWPGSGGTGQVRMQLTLNDGTTSNLVTSGAWALNRFFDRARTAPGSTPLSRKATFTVDGRQVTLEFTPNSIRNPFQLHGFSCP